MTDAPTSGGKGEGLGDDPHHVRADLNLITRAVRQGWPVTAQAKEQAVEVAQRIMNSGEADERSRVAALKALIEMDKVNQTDHWNEDKNVRLDAGKATERVDGVVLKVAGLDAKD